MSSPTFSFTFSAAFSKNCNTNTPARTPAQVKPNNSTPSPFSVTADLLIFTEHGHDVLVEAGLEHGAQQVHGHLRIRVAAQTGEDR